MKTAQARDPVHMARSSGSPGFSSSAPREEARRATAFCWRRRIAVPGRGIEIPSTRIEMPGGGNDIPVPCTASPAPGNWIPRHGIATPAGGIAIPSHGISFPGSGNAMPLTGVALPLTGSAYPGRGSAVPLPGIPVRSAQNLAGEAATCRTGIRRTAPQTGSRRRQSRN